MPTTVRDTNTEENQLNPSAKHSRELFDLEQQAGSHENIPGTTSSRRHQEVDDLNTFFENSPGDMEDSAGQSSPIKYTGSGMSSRQSRFEKFVSGAKRKGPIGAIIAILIGGGGLTGFLGTFGGAGIHLREVLVNKFDTMSSIAEERSALILKGRYFEPSSTCKIKLRCKFNGTSNRQIERLRAMGGDLLDADGKPLQKNAFGRYTGGKILVMPDQPSGKPGKKIDAKNFIKELRTNQELRRLNRTIFASRFTSFNDPVAKKIRAAKRLTSNPKINGDSEKEVQQAVHGAVSGDTVTALANTQYQTDADGSIVKDADGNPIPLGADSGAAVDMLEDMDGLNEEIDKLDQLAAAGDPIPNLPSDPVLVASLDDYTPKGSLVKNGLKNTMSFLNPLSFTASYCTTYSMANAVVTIAKTYQVANHMRFASLFTSVMDEVRAGKSNTTKMNAMMTILMRPDKFGRSFGDSLVYQSAAYGAIAGGALGASTEGNSTIQLVATAIATTNSFLGGAGKVRTACGVLTNPFVQGALSLTSLIPGGGQALSILKNVAVQGGMAAVRKKVADTITSKIAGSATKEALQSAAKKGGKQLVEMATSKGMAFFLTGFIMGKYGIPYLARVMSGNDVSASMDGATAADIIGNGMGQTVYETAITGGQMVLQKQDALAFKQFNNEYIASYTDDMRSSSNPLDINNPYSPSNAIASAYTGFVSKLQLGNITGPSVLKTPGVILSSLNPTKLLASAKADNSQQELDFCQDEYLREKNIATTIQCHPIVGFNDTAMLKSTNPDDVITWLIENKQLDEDGAIVAGSNLEGFINTCTATGKNVMNVGDPEAMLDPDCYDAAKQQTKERKMFHLYVIDNRIDVAMEYDFNSTEGPIQSSSATPEICKTMPTTDLGQIACKAYQFDEYGYKFGGGHGDMPTAKGFMDDFRAGNYTAGSDAILDCSGLVRVAIYEATGFDTGPMTTYQYRSYKGFQQVSKEEARAGDIILAHNSGHTEIIVSNNTNDKKYTTFGAHTDRVAFPKQIGQTTYSYNDAEAVFRFVRSGP